MNHSKGIFLILAFFAVLNWCQTNSTNQPDVLLNIPNLSVKEILLEVDNIKVGLNLEASVANLVGLNAGVALSIDSVKLNITNVTANALLLVHLDNVRNIVSDTIGVLNSSTDLVQTLIDSLNGTLGAVGGILGDITSQTGNLLETAALPSDNRRRR